MKRRRVSRSHVTAVAGVLLAGLLGLSIADSFDRREAPASPAALARVAAKNDRATAEAAARMRADSEEQAKAADLVRAERESASAD